MLLQDLPGLLPNASQYHPRGRAGYRGRFRGWAALGALLLIFVPCVSSSATDFHKDWGNSLKPSGKPGPELRLAFAGMTDYHILLPAAATTQEEKAAADLARWLKAMTGAEFPVVHEGKDYQASAPRISIGRTALLKEANLRIADAQLAGEGFAIGVKDLLGGDTRGIINAVYAILEEDLGCRWYARGTNTIPRTTELRFRPVSSPHFSPAS